MGDIQVDPAARLVAVESGRMSRADLGCMFKEAVPQSLLHADGRLDDRLAYVPTRISLTPTFPPVPAHSMAPSGP